MQVTRCRLILHDSLYYATREMGRLYETEKVIHNWALTYALGLIQKPYRCFDSVPTYQDDLTPINAEGVYVTPAKPIHYDYVISTFNSRTIDIAHFQLLAIRGKRSWGLL